MADVACAVIGGGVVGLAVAAELAGPMDSLVLLERHESFGRETSSRNSEVVHAGIYYETGSRKAQLCVEGRRRLYQFAEENGVSFRKCGKIIVAVTPEEEASLDRLLERGRANGVEGLRLLTAEEVREREPHVRAVAGLLSPETGIVDSHRLMESLERQTESRGADVVYGCEVVGLEPDGGEWIVRYRDSQEESVLRVQAVVNAAGLEAQAVMRMAGLEPNENGLRRHLAKGEYFSVSGSKRLMVNGLVYPSPEADLVGLGIHTVVDLGGGLKLGPSAFYVDEIEYGVDPSHRDSFYQAVKSYLPFLAADDLVPDMSGIRPKLAGAGEAPRDFYIAHEEARGLPGFFNLAGIESPGLTASLAIGKLVAEMVNAYLL